MQVSQLIREPETQKYKTSMVIRKPSRPTPVVSFQMTIGHALKRNLILPASAFQQTSLRQAYDRLYSFQHGEFRIHRPASLSSRDSSHYRPHFAKPQLMRIPRAKNDSECHAPNRHPELPLQSWPFLCENERIPGSNQ